MKNHDKSAFPFYFYICSFVWLKCTTVHKQVLFGNHFENFDKARYFEQSRIAQQKIKRQQLESRTSESQEDNDI